MKIGIRLNETQVSTHSVWERNETLSDHFTASMRVTVTTLARSSGE